MGGTLRLYCPRQMGGTHRQPEREDTEMSKYEIKPVHHSDGSEDTFVIYSFEEAAFFAGYDFMGSVNWEKIPSSECELTAEDDPEQIVKDLESADEQAEPEGLYIHAVNKWGKAYDYQIVNKIPDGFDVWNVNGIEGHPDYLPLCICYEGTYSVVIDQLLAIRMPKADQKILHDCSMITGAGNLVDVRRLLKRKNLKERTRKLAEQALPLFEKYTDQKVYI